MVDIKVVNPDEAATDQSRWLRGDIERGRQLERGGQRQVSYTGLDSLPGGRAAVRNVETDSRTGLMTAHTYDGEIYEQDARTGCFVKVDNGDVQDGAADFLRALATKSGIKTPGVGVPGGPGSVTEAVVGSQESMRAAAERALAREGIGPIMTDLPGVPVRRPGMPIGRPGAHGIPLSLTQQGAMRRGGLGGVPEGPSNQAKNLLESFSGVESYDGEKLLRTFPILFDNTQDPPVSLAQAGLSLIAVKTTHDHGKIEGIPEYASFLGRKVVPGLKTGMVSFFVVDSDSARTVVKAAERDKTCVVDHFDRDGVYVAGHAGGVSLFGPGLEFVQGLNYERPEQRSAVYTKLSQRFGTAKPRMVNLSEQGASTSIDVVELPKDKINGRKAFMATFSLPPEFGDEKNDVRLWRAICENFSRTAKANSCIPLIYGNTFTVMTNLEDPTALETHEDVAMVVGATFAYLSNLARTTQGKTNFDARMYQSTTTCEPVDGSPKSRAFRGNWTGYQQAMRKPGFDNKVYADPNCTQFDHRKDPRQRLVATEFEAVKGADGLFVLSKISPIRDRVAAGQVFEFVGRADEMQQMDRVVAKSDEGLQMCLVTGHTGAGKTALVLRAASEKVGNSNTVVLAFRNKDNLAALTELTRGLLDMLKPALDADPDLAATPDYTKNLALARNFVGPNPPADYRYDEQKTLDAIVFMFEALSSSLQGRKCMWVLDDVDAAGNTMRTVLLKLLTQLSAKAANLKGINVFGTIRSVEDHAGVTGADREYVGAVKGKLDTNQLDVKEFVLRTAEGGYAPWLEEFLVKRCLRVSPDLAQPIEGLDLANIAELCSKMASSGGKIHDAETVVSAHSLKLIVDNLVSGGFVTLDQKKGTVSCSRAQFDAASTAIGDGTLPCGPKDIYRSQVIRATKDVQKKNLLYLAVILRGLDYRILENDQVAEFFGTRLLRANGPGFKAKLDALRIKHDGTDPERESAMLSAGNELDMHTLWRNEVETTMQDDDATVKTLREMAFRALLFARRDPAISQYVDAVMMFDLAMTCDENTAKEVVFEAIRDAIGDHNYAKAKQCALFAREKFAGEPAKLCEANFYLAKAGLYTGEVEEAKKVLATSVMKHQDLLPPELKIELVEIFLERFRLDVIGREMARDGRGMAIALGEYDKAGSTMAGFVAKLRSSTGGADVESAKYWADVAVQYNQVEALYKRSVRRITGDLILPFPDAENPGQTKNVQVLKAVDLSKVEGVSDPDRGFQLAINLCEGLLASLDGHVGDARKTDVMKAKVANLLSAIILQKNRDLVGADEEKMAVRVTENADVRAAFERVVELTNKTLLIARQTGGLGADYSVEARAAANRFYAASFLNPNVAEVSDFKRVAYEYLINTDKNDGRIALGNMYCGLIANLFRDDLDPEAKAEMSTIATGIAKFQYQESPDSWDRMFNYVESLIFKAADAAEPKVAQQALQESYAVLKRIADERKQLPEAGKEEYRYLSLLLVARHEVLSSAKGITTAVDGAPFDYKHLLTANKPEGVHDNEIIKAKKAEADLSESVGEKTIFNGNGSDAGQIMSWSDLVNFGKYPALRHVFNSLRK